MSKKSKTILLILVVFVSTNLLTRGPDLARALNQPADKWYTGQASWFDPWDLNLYFSIIGWGKRDGILFENLYDTESVQGAPIYSFYTLLGKIALLFGFSNAFTFHLAGLIFSFFLIATTWWFVRIFLKKGSEKVVVFLLLFFGGGLGWLFFPKTILPDVGQPGFTLANAIRRPHEAISLSLFLLTLGGFWQGVVYKKKRSLFLASLSSFLMLFFHPYNFIPLGLVLVCFGLYWWAKTGTVGFLKILALLVFEGVIFYFLIGKNLLSNPAFSGLTRQIQHSPSPFQTILGWGVLFPLTITAIFFKKGRREATFLKLWFTLHWLLAYFPFGFQRSIIRGLWIPTVILAVKGLGVVCRKTKWDYRAVVGLLLVFTSFSGFFMTFKRMTESSENRWIYLTKEEGEIFHYLKNHGNNEEGVLASYRIANLIPANTRKRVWAGHRFQTPQFEKRIVRVNRFFAGEMKEKEARLFLQKTKTVWVFWGPEEKAISKLTTIPAKTLMEPMVEKKTVSLYRVRQR